VHELLLELLPEVLKLFPKLAACHRSRHIR
jgi:hypothetical protein